MVRKLRVADFSRRERIAEACREIVEPAATGLPNWRVLTWFPLLVVVGGAILIVLGISGTSSGAQWLVFGDGGVDPQILLGGPRLIRSDEWLVQQGWVVSQAQQGFPLVNRTFPGGMDTSVVFELPAWDWTALLRPHAWGFLAFGVDVGVAWQWWIPAMGLVAGAYMLVVTLLPNRPLTSALVAAAVYFSPIFQWWYGPNSLWPAAWALLAMAGTVWMLRDPRLWVRVVWAVVLGWLAVTMAIGLYIPFVVPSLLVFVFFFVGAVLQERPWAAERARRTFGRLVPLLAAGVAAMSVTGIFVATRFPSFVAAQATVYPGVRSDQTGRLLVEDPHLTGFGGAPLGQSFATSNPNILGPNPSEAATAILLAVFLAPALVWFIVRGWRRDATIDWLLVATTAGLGLVLAYLLVPGWDSLARLLLLDKVPVPRFRMGFAVMLPLFFALVAREVVRHPGRRTLPISILCGLLAVALTGWVVGSAWTLDPGTLADSRLWPVAALGICASVVLVFFRRTIPIAAAALLVAALSIGAAVNPLYRGIFDLNDTAIGKAVIETNTVEAGTWVGVGSYETMAVLVSSGVESYSGMQPYPSDEMWKAIDPEGRYEDAWNRLAHVRWTFGQGEPVSVNPQRDQIVTTFDACSAFAQGHVDFVLADSDPPSMDCLVQLDLEEQGTSRMAVYGVVASAR
ncbi:uncharacterized membrane protein YqaE (UPF0057 family) [Conyzicola nivalis]|uniref:Uncharacterized membrane protein YqaE (UPF0057 family) n=1 Tax=Conyzicola nivalis TaxID=1477021 RepID=A0ABV2QRD0_9MICO